MLSVIGGNMSVIWRAINNLVNNASKRILKDDQQ